jgi:hypothetical protein
MRRRCTCGAVGLCMLRYLLLLLLLLRWWVAQHAARAGHSQVPAERPGCQVVTWRVRLHSRLGFAHVLALPAIADEDVVALFCSTSLSLWCCLVCLVLGISQTTLAV